MIFLPKLNFINFAPFYDNFLMKGLKYIDVDWYKTYIRFSNH